MPFPGGLGRLDIALLHPRFVIAVIKDKHHQAPLHIVGSFWNALDNVPIPSKFVDFYPARALP